MNWNERFVDAIPESDVDYWKRAADALDSCEGPVPSLAFERWKKLWWVETKNVVVLARWMAEGGAFGSLDIYAYRAPPHKSADAVIALFEEPWRFAAQWDAFSRNLSYAQFLSEKDSA